MSSSLDDMEDSEFFQQELDEHLSFFSEEQDLNSYDESLIHRFIEFVCVEKNFANINDANEVLNSGEFIDYLHIGLKGFDPDMVSQLIQKFLDSFDSRKTFDNKSNV